MIKEIPKSDVIVRAFKVYKEWTLDENDIVPVIGENIKNSLFDTDTDPKSGNLYKRLVYQSIESQFYRNHATASVLTEVGLRKNYTSEDERNIHAGISVSDEFGNPLTTDIGEFIELDSNEIFVLSIPRKLYGEGVKAGSVTLFDKVRNITYTDDGNSNLINNFDNKIDGNIFYDRGLVVMRGHITGYTFNQFTLNFRSTKTIYENEIFISVLESEFNTSTNPSAYYEDGGYDYNVVVNKTFDNTLTQTYTKKIHKDGIKYLRNSQNPYYSSITGYTSGSVNARYGSFDDYDVSGSLDPTGSYLAPYITTIALYDDDLNIVAVAKLPQPIKSLHDYPLNFIIRFDS
jgi:hypothetical protein